MITDEEARVIELNLHNIGEHFSEVLVLVSRLTPEGKTERYFASVGNWFATRGMAREFIRRENTLELADEIANRIINS